MSELMRFNLARSPQRTIPLPGTLVYLDGLHELAPDTRAQLNAEADSIRSGTESAVATELIGRSLVSSGQNGDIIDGLYDLDRWLAILAGQEKPEQHPTVDELRSKVYSLLGAVLPPADQYAWNLLHQILAQDLFIVILANAQQVKPEYIRAQEEISRLLFVIALVDSLIAEPSRINSIADIWQALKARSLVLPDYVVQQLMKVRTSKGAATVRKAGFADLYITREEWDHYEAAEIASIENILSGELKSHVHLLSNSRTVGTTTDSSSSTTNSLETTTTDNTQLQSQSTADIRLAAHVDGKVDTSGQYGPTKVDTHLGGSLDYSTARADSRAATQSRETVSRAVNSLVQTTRTIRTESTKSVSRDKERHDFDNTKGTSPVVGIYRWLDQIRNVIVERYPHRFLLEFELPEPGAWLRWLHEDDVSRGMLNKLPQDFVVEGTSTPLSPSVLTSESYEVYVRRYSVAGVPPYPKPQYVSAHIKRDPPDDLVDPNAPWRRQFIKSEQDTSATVPAGTVAKTWAASVEGWTSGPGFLDLAVGSAEKVPVTPDESGGSFRVTASGTIATPAAPIPGITGSTIPISVLTQDVWNYVINIIVECVPSDQAITEWQANTFDQLLSAYNQALSAYNNERLGSSIKLPNPVDSSSPQANEKAILQELKRQVVEMLIGVRFEGIPGAIESVGNTKEPRTKLDTAISSAPTIQFIEQAFEWETISYICYPYYWADSTRWRDLALITGVDQAYVDFLRAGSARVILAARPGFEAQVNLYAQLGLVWGGGNPPGPGDPDYLSAAEEIRARDLRPRDLTVVDSWQVRVPTTLIWLQNSEPLPRNVSTTIVPHLTVVAVSPEAARVSERILVKGTGFGDFQRSGVVQVGGAVATVVCWSDTEITAAIPDSLKPGKVSVLVVAGGDTSNKVALTVTGSGGEPGGSGPSQDPNPQQTCLLDRVCGWFRNPSPSKG